MDNSLMWLIGMMQDRNNYEERLVARTKIENYTIDTAYTSDYGYETAIWKDDNDMVIVERYPDMEESEEGHKKWCDFCKTKPEKVYSVQFDEEMKL